MPVSTGFLIYESLKLIGIYACVAGMLFLIIRARGWTGPALDSRISVIEEENHIIRGNLARIDRDLTVFIRTGNDANSHILRELDGIKEMLQGDISIRRQFETMADKLDTLEQVVKNIPCLAGSSDDCADTPKGT